MDETNKSEPYFLGGDRRSWSPIPSTGDSRDAIASYPEHRFTLDACELIAKEGRKYGLTLCLATQRPRDLPAAVLSQIGTLIVHRRSHSADREVVEAACSDVTRGGTAFLPSLTPGEALLVGVDLPIPLTLRIQEPSEEHQPKSRGPDYHRYWAGTEAPK